ncbi:S-protein homolog 5-like [Lactuca sativa]|uniref:S-protein homolog n=1 Tax=Lactuca sativa TaxID=4236 RepID=A0A9R1VM38_LACSA|nr:S-protein homolog 5-like [Lactuca sativa]XP_023756292.1 S-protein homolog 5 [Lactuca sativa]XP_052627797.1 S-protein homolog 5-like [Lactuca sativa]XP_052627798.1 S-protein homolog 5-like [Lactuca sativa]XP_052627799.1 S-protein homolog 5-like [Lactuca sativa]KAJ0207143.1 hypothetical protein LSAT_V11C500256500 [Lactuca sativa]
MAFLCPFTTKWNVSVISALREDLVVHIKSGDDDLGNHTIPYVGNYSWSFCEKVGGHTLFYAYFWWGSKFQSLDLFNEAISKKCYLNVGTEHCYWFVTPKGFYVDAHPSGGGEFIKGWA